MSAVVDFLAANWWAVLALAVVMRAGLAWQSELSWPEYRTAHGIKRVAFSTLDRLDASDLPIKNLAVFGRVAKAAVRFDSWVNDKRGRTDAEYLRTVETDVRATVGRLRAGVGSLHLISSIKRRPADHGDPLTAAHVVWTHDDGSQTEAYLFRNDDGTTDAYAHHETSVADPDGHLTDPQHDGDPRGVVIEALDPGE